jgi:PAS domain S-box-containing protein
MADEHYLRAELYELVRSDPAIFEFLQAGSLDGIWYWDLENTENEWMSPRFWEVFGYEPSEKQHQASEWQDMIHPDDLALALENFELHCADARHPFDQLVRYRHKNGSTVWVRCRGLAIRDEEGRPVRMLGTHNEVTALKASEEETKKALELAESIIATVKQPLMVLDSDLRIVSTNRAFSSAFGQTADALKGNPLFSIMAGQWDVPELHELLAKVVPDGLELTDFEIEIDFPVVGRRILLVDARRIYRPGNHTKTILLSLEDVTSRRLLEEENRRTQTNLQRRLDARNKQLDDSKAELSRTEKLLLSFLESIPFGLFVVDREGKPYFANAAAVELLGKGVVPGTPPEKLAEAYSAYRSGTDVLYPTDELPLVRALRGESVVVTDMEVKKPEGRVPLWASGAPVRDASGEIVFGLVSFQDVSEQNRLHAELRQAQKMEAVGRLAGGVAHDFNNLLTAIYSFSGFVMEDMRSEDPAYGDMMEVRKAAERAGALTRQLLAFSRRQAIAPKVISINGLVEDMDRMLRRTLGEDIEFSTRLHDRLWATKVDPGQLEQVIVNIAVNARDAMGTGGKLTIETDNITLDEICASARGGAIQPGEYVMVAISDDGEGMDQETQQSIFEPFFTTKPEGQGTGLGLSTCYGIVKQAGGAIWVYSEVGQGTTVKVYLPRFVGEAQELQAPVRPSNLRGTETVMVCEDDDQVRALMTRTLTRFGYTVLDAANGGEAILIAEGHEGTIDLLITDVVMPRMSGKQLVERIIRIHPFTRVLYVSGYTANAIVHRGVLVEGVVLLQKPFTPDSLAAIVRQVLDAQGPEMACEIAQSADPTSVTQQR